MRSHWKPNTEFMTKNITNEVTVYNPSTFIPKKFFDVRIKIYTGRHGFSIIVRDYMVGTKFGYYAICKKTGDFHPQHVKKRKKRKKTDKKKTKKKIKKEKKGRKKRRR